MRFEVIYFKTRGSDYSEIQTGFVQKVLNIIIIIIIIISVYSVFLQESLKRVVCVFLLYLRKRPIPEDNCLIYRSSEMVRLEKKCASK